MSGEDPLNRTPLYENHRQAGAKLVDFAGWEMPISYSGIIDEHMAVRRAAGLFDTSHMGRFRVWGPEALRGVQWVVTRDVEDMPLGAARYGLVLNPEGGILDDIVIYKRAVDDFFLVVNAGNREKILAWIQAQLKGFDLKIQDRSSEIAMLALQGPMAMKILGSGFQRRGWRFEETRLMDQEVWMAYTGYTGEQGAEIFVKSSAAPLIWEGLMQAGKSLGLKPAGLGARDTLRLEMGYPLYGNDLSEDTTPLEASLDWVVGFDKKDFVGKQALVAQQEKGIDKKLIGFKCLKPGVPRHDYKILAAGRPIGHVSSGNMSPMMRYGIGMGYVESAFAELNTEIAIEVRNKQLPAVVVKWPFYHKD